MKFLLPFAIVLCGWVSPLFGRDLHLDTPHILLFPPDRLTDKNRMFQGIPGLVGTKNGRMWATWYGGGRGEDDDNAVMLVTSGDAGKTWSEIKLVVDVPGPVRCFDPVVWVDPKNRLWLFWGQAFSHGIEAHTWAMVTENPEEENPVWRRPFMVHPGVMMNKPTVTKNGNWLLPISDWEGRRKLTPGAATALVVISRDSGDTFELLGAARVPAEQRQYDEHILVERKDRSLRMYIRTLYGIGESNSYDGGKTWSEVQPSSVKHVTSRFFIRRLQSGNLLMVKHGELDQRLPNRAYLKAFISRDDGATWEGGLLLDERVGVSYPDGFQDEDGLIHIVYDYSRRSAKEILLASFTEEDILARAQIHGQRYEGGRPDQVSRSLINRAKGKL